MRGPFLAGAVCGAYLVGVAWLLPEVAADAAIVGVWLAVMVGGILVLGERVP